MSLGVEEAVRIAKQVAGKEIGWRSGVNIVLDGCKLICDV
jgi:hypothetical protein